MPMQVFTVGQVLAASDVNEYLVNTRYAVKPSDTSRSLTTTLANDPDLTLPVDASKSYRLEICLVYTAVNATGDFKFAFTLPASTTFTGTAFSNLSGAISFGTYQAAGALLTAAATAAGGGAVPLSVIINGVLVTSSTAGSLTCQWAQSVSNGTPTILKQGSYMLLRRVS